MKNKLQSKLDDISTLVHSTLSSFDDPTYSEYVSECIESDLDNLLQSLQLYTIHNYQTLSFIHYTESLANKFLLPYFIITLNFIKFKFSITPPSHLQ
jgi:hypothetical protein